MEMRYQDLFIRNAEQSDAETLCRWWNDGSVMISAGFPNGLGKTVEEVREQIAGDNDEDRHMILLCKGVRAGECNYRLYEDHAEIGIKICDPEYRDRSNGKVWLSLLIEKLFERTDLIRLDTNYRNAKARLVYQTLGFRSVRIERGGWTDQLGEKQDVIYYELRKEDFTSFAPRYYLRQPEMTFADSIRSYREEFLEAGEEIPGAGGLRKFDDPEKWIADCGLKEQEDMLPPGIVPAEQYCYIDHYRDEVVGMVNIRPDMKGNANLLLYAGQIGYSVRPSRRGERIGTILLADTLRLCKKKYRLEEVLVTCLASNTASKEVILNNEGVFEGASYYAPAGEDMLRYRIRL